MSSCRSCTIDCTVAYNESFARRDYDRCRSLLETHPEELLAKWSPAELLLKSGILHFEMERFEEATTYLQQAFRAGGYAAFGDADPRYLQLIDDFVARRISRFRLVQNLLRLSLVLLIVTVVLVIRNGNNIGAWLLCLAAAMIFFVLRSVTLKINPYSKDFPDPRPKRRPTVLPPNLPL